MKRALTFFPVILLALFLAGGCRRETPAAELPLRAGEATAASDGVTVTKGPATATTMAIATVASSPIPTPAPSRTARATATPTPTPSPTASRPATASPTPSVTPTPLHPLSIAALRQDSYPGSELVMEETLAPGAGHARYIASYRSEGYTIYGLLTIPYGEPPAEGWPAILLNHGYVPPYEYESSETYKAHADAFARHQYVVFVPDYRGHGNSEGQATVAYAAPAYTVDVLNALASVKRHPAVDAERIGMFGHSLGGYITLRIMVARDDVQAGVIWAGVVSPYADFYYSLERRFGHRPTPTPDPAGEEEQPRRRRWWQALAEAYGTPAENPAFWASISATAFLEDISGPLQLHHGTADEVVPVAFSETLKEQMDEVYRYAALNLYEGDDHNLSRSFTPAMVASISFFDRFVKGADR